MSMSQRGAVRFFAWELTLPARKHTIPPGAGSRVGKKIDTLSSLTSLFNLFTIPSKLQSFKYPHSGDTKGCLCRLLTFTFTRKSFRTVLSSTR